LHVGGVGVQAVGHHERLEPVAEAHGPAGGVRKGGWEERV
jgi:hypothetical protein